MKLVDLTYLALNAAKKRKSSQTGFIHHCYEDPHSRETIPLFENFCLALTLFRMRTAEQALEAKALLSRLFAFQVGCNFPIYLHEFPQCRDERFASKLYPIFFFLYEEFKQFLGEDLRLKIADFLQATPPPLPKENLPSNPQAIADFILSSQIQERIGKLQFGSTPSFATPSKDYSLKEVAKTWDLALCAYKGSQLQEGYEPAVTLYDLFLGEFSGRFSKRALEDHPVHLRACLISPSQESLDFKPACFTSSLPLFWGGPDHLHSLVYETKGEYKEGTFLLPIQPVEEVTEVALYCDAHPETQLLINGKKANTFRLGDTLLLKSGGREISLSFDLIEGDGRFWGHIFRASRPGQLKNGAYDWKIALRTIKRDGACLIRLFLDADLSLACSLSL